MRTTGSMREIEGDNAPSREASPVEYSRTFTGLRSGRAMRRARSNQKSSEASYIIAEELAYLSSPNVTAAPSAKRGSCKMRAQRA